MRWFWYWITHEGLICRKIFFLNFSRALKATLNLLKEAELNEDGDEEIAYVLYMLYFNLISGIKKTSEYKKDEVTRKRGKKKKTVSCFEFL